MDAIIAFVTVSGVNAIRERCPVEYESRQGDRPIAITWRLGHPLPASVYERYATLRVG